MPGGNNKVTHTYATGLLELRAYLSYGLNYFKCYSAVIINNNKNDRTGYNYLHFNYLGSMRTLAYKKKQRVVIS